MSSGFSPELRKELLDDFYAECDELLTSIRQGLGQLAGARHTASEEVAVIEGLFRNTHSIKGISSIVGLRPAERVAHGMEDMLRAITKKQMAVSEAVVDVLFRAAQRLENIVTAHRLSKDIPEVEGMLEELQEFLPEQPGPHGEADAEPVADRTGTADAVAAARARGLVICVARFTPAPELDARGVNLASVRGRLSALGEILDSSPKVREKGSIEFEFVLGLMQPPSDAAPWERDGVQFEVQREEEPSSAPDRRAVPDALSLTPSHIVRVDLARLDDLMRIAGQMVIQKSQLEEALQQHPGAQEDLRDVNRSISRSLRELRSAISRVRTVPVAEIFARMPFVVRDLARGSEKKAQVVLEGQSTEVDKYLVERLKEPLLHMVRNAFAHGIESAADRTLAGKPEEATITLSARIAGEFAVIGIRDDGRGVDPRVIAVQAAKAGLAVPADLDSSAQLEILCSPGFSTREHADMAAGRGMGMSVVATAVRDLGGTMKFESQPGKGAAFTLKLPLAISIAEAVIVSVADETFAVQQSAVDELLLVPSSDLRSIRSTEVIPYRSGLLPLVRLGKSFGTGGTAGPSVSVLVVGSERGAVGLVVDRVRGQREVVIRPLLDPLLQVSGFSGATELGDGRPILVLDPSDITRGVVRPNEVAAAAT